MVRDMPWILHINAFSTAERERYYEDLKWVKITQNAQFSSLESGAERASSSMAVALLTVSEHIAGTSVESDNSYRKTARRQMDRKHKVS